MEAVTRDVCVQGLKCRESPGAARNQEIVMA